MANDKQKEAEPYERPECWKLAREQYTNGTPEDFARWRAEAAPVQERNAVRLRSRAQAKREIEVLISQAWPRGSDGFKAMTRALSKASVEGPPDFADGLLRMEQDAKRKQEEAANKTAWDAEHVRKLVAAGAFLSARGKVLGVDYDAERAIEEADEIAKDEAIAAHAKAGGFVSFSGEDDCEGCSGWDMKSNRCECGNRRVYWESDGDFESMSVYAAAN